MRKITGNLIVVSVCARVLAAPSPLLVPNTWNDGVATGNWSADANWSQGHAPTAAETVYLTNRTAAAGYKVTLDTPWTSIGTNALVIGNASGSATNTLTIASTLSVNRDTMPMDGSIQDRADRFWDIRVEKGGRIALQDGGALVRRYGSYAKDYGMTTFGNCFLSVKGGGSFLQTGGDLLITDNSFQGIALGDNTGNAISRWDMTGGRFVWDDVIPNGGQCPSFDIAKNGVFTMSGDAVFTNAMNNGASRVSSWRMTGGTVDLSDRAQMVLNHAGSHLFGHGQTIVHDEAQLVGIAARMNLLIVPMNSDSAGSVARVEVLDDARFSHKGYDSLIGGLSGRSAIFTYASTRTDGAFTDNGMFVGFDAGYGELNVRSGQLTCGSVYGMYVGADDLVSKTTANYCGSFYRESVEHAAPTGLVRVTGGLLKVGGKASQGYGYRWLVGLNIGDGLRLPNPNALTDPFESRLYNGRMEVSGGDVDVESHLVVGSGRAVGSVLQTGGDVLVRGSCDTPMITGIAGGHGNYVISNGTLTVKSSLHVGGATVDMLRRTDWDAAHGYGMPVSAQSTIPKFTMQFDRHDAKGRMVVASYDSAKPAVLKVTNAITVSSDGAGTFEVGGSYATVEAKDMVVSNAVSAVEGGESKIRFVADANGLSTIKLSGNLTIADGAKLEVNMSAYAGESNTKFKLFDCVSRTGRFQSENVTLVNCRLVQESGDPAIYVKAGKGGLVLIFR